MCIKTPRSPSVYSAISRLYSSRVRSIERTLCQDGCCIVSFSHQLQRLYTPRRLGPRSSFECVVENWRNILRLFLPSEKRKRDSTQGQNQRELGKKVIKVQPPSFPVSPAGWTIATEKERKKEKKKMKPSFVAAVEPRVCCLSLEHKEYRWSQVVKKEREREREDKGGVGLLEEGQVC